jgi:hypothetical protein
MDPKTVRALHRECALRLERFIKEAGKMCELLGEMEEFPLSRAVKALPHSPGEKKTWRSRHTKKHGDNSSDLRLLPKRRRRRSNASNAMGIHLRDLRWLR